LQLVKVIMKEKYPLKSESAIGGMLETIQNGRIDEWIWCKILDKMYEENDSSHL